MCATLSRENLLVDLALNGLDHLFELLPESATDDHLLFVRGKVVLSVFVTRVWTGKNLVRRMIDDGFLWML